MVALLGVLAVWGGGRLAAMLTPVVPIEVDTKIGSMASGQMSALAPECKNPLAKKYVEDIARPLLEAAQPLPFEFQFRVTQDEMVNAFALPGGFVTVNYGLLKKSETGEEVAGVIGHEIQHALLRHGTKRILRELGGSIALSLILGGSDLHEVGQVASQVTGLSYDRDQESEADLRGVDLMLKSGIDPSGLAVFFERLKKDSVSPPELMSTHPDPGNRAERIRAAKLSRVRIPLPSPRDIPCD